MKCKIYLKYSKNYQKKKGNAMIKYRIGIKEWMQIEWNRDVLITYEFIQRNNDKEMRILRLKEVIKREEPLINKN